MKVMFGATFAIAAITFGALAQPAPEPKPDVQSDEPLSLDLSCHGDGKAKRTITFGTTKVVPGQLPKAPPSFTSDINFRGVARIRVREGGRSEILLPREMLSDGKFQTSGMKEIRKVEIGPDLIAGKVAISVVYEPKIIIDRQLGQLTVVGSQSSFAATCERLTAEDRRF